MSIFNVGQQVECVYRKGNGQGCLANLDLTNTIFVGHTRALDGAADTIPPLGSIIVDGSQDIYASTQSQAVTVRLQSTPGVTNWAPSPAQVAAQISALGLATATLQGTQIGHESNIETNTGGFGMLGQLNGSQSGALISAAGLTISKDMLHANTGVTTEIAALIATGSAAGAPGGVPLLKSHNVLFTAASTSLTVGTPVAVPVAIKAFSQVGYSLFFDCYASAAAQLQVNVEWFDTGSGQAVDQQTYWINPGNGSGNPHGIRITGPTEGNGVQVILTAFTGNITVTNLLFAQSSTVYQRHFPLTTVMTTLAGITNVAFTDPLAFLLGDISATALTTGANQATVPAFYAGRVQLFGATTSGTTDCSVNVSVTADQSAAGGHTLYQDNTDAKGFLNAYLTLPRSQCTVTVTNQNAGTQSCRFTLVAAPEG